MLVGHEDQVVGPVAGGRVHVQTDVGLKFVTRARGAVDDLLDTLAQRVDGLLDDGLQQAWLRRDVLVDSRLADARLGGDVVEGRIRITAPLEHPGGGSHQVLGLERSPPAHKIPLSGQVAAYLNLIVAKTPLPCTQDPAWPGNSGLTDTLVMRHISLLAG